MILAVDLPFKKSPGMTGNIGARELVIGYFISAAINLIS